MRSAVRVDPAIIREVLASCDATNQYQASKKHGVHPRTVNRWLTRRAQTGPAWPTDEDIAAWREDREANAERRDRGARRAAEYRKRCYLNRGPVQVDSRGVTRRLQALYALGWTLDDLGKGLGVTRARVGHLMNGLYPKLHPATAEPVYALYEKLCMTVPVDTGPGTRIRGQVRVHLRARNQAKARGYAPPLAWDDIDTDEHPQLGQPRPRGHDEVDHSIVERVLDGERIATTPAEKRLVLERWRARGGVEGELCTRMGWRQGRYTPRELGVSA